MLFDEKTSEIIKMCKYCFMCRHACPTFLATKLDSHTPRGYAINLSRINEGMTDWDEEGMERLFHCSQCGLCKELCEFSWSEDEMVLEGRREMIKAGKEPAVVKETADELINTNGSKNDLYPDDFYDKEDCDVLYIAGTALLNGQQTIVKSVCEIFNKANTNYTMFSVEDTGGVILYELGYKERAFEWASSFIEKINRVKPKRIVTSCAHTYSLLKNKLKDLNLNIEIPVLHLLEYIEQIQMALKQCENEQVMYHDPCHIGRENGIYDIPRNIIKACSGNPVVEFHHNKNEAECCGAGASVDITYPRIAASVAKKRIEQAIEKDIKTIVTACPNCKNVFEKAISQMESNIKVKDIAEYIQSSI